MLKNKDFFESIYQLVKKIPYGRVSTYGLIAQALGSKSSARVIGWALNSAHKNKLVLPAHRVVNKNGLLSGKHNFDFPDKMEKLLEREGIEVEKDKIINFEKTLWNPIFELDDISI